MHVRLNVLVVVLLFCLCSVSFAQEDDSWSAIVYDPVNNAMVTLSLDGIVKSVELPESAVVAVVSPNGRYAAYIPLTPETMLSSMYPPPSPNIKIYDLETKECCLVIDENTPTIAEEVTLANFGLGLFSPDSTAFVATTENGKVVYDLASESIIAAKTSNTFGGKIVYWGADGIVTVSYMMALPGGSPNPYSASRARAWNPFTDDILVTETTVVSVPDDFILHDLGDFLATGEHIVESFGEALSGDTPTGVYMGMILYEYDGQRYPILVDQSSSYVNPYSLRRTVKMARWVVDGQYVYMRPHGPMWMNGEQVGDENTVVLLGRDGSLITVDSPEQDSFLIGTPDGWLAAYYNGAKQEILHYQFVDGEVTITSIAEFEGETTLKYAPLLGASLDEVIPFPEVDPPRSIG